MIFEILPKMTFVIKHQFAPINNQFVEVIEYAHALNKKIVVNTPRTTYQRELDDLNALLSTVDMLDERPDGVMVSNLGSLTLAKKFSLPIRADLSFNLFNPKAAALLKELGVTMAAARKPYRMDWRWQYGDIVCSGNRTGESGISDR